MDSNPPGSSVRGVFQARILEQFALSYSHGIFLNQGLNPCLLHLLHWQVKVKVIQSCLTLCNPIGIVCGILQARTLEWVAFPFSRGSSQPRNQTRVSCIAVHSLPPELCGKLHSLPRLTRLPPTPGWGGGNRFRICLSSLHRGHANLLCMVPIVVYVLPKEDSLLCHLGSPIVDWRSTNQIL